MMPSWKKVGGWRTLPTDLPLNFRVPRPSPVLRRVRVFAFDLNASRVGHPLVSILKSANPWPAGPVRPWVSGDRFLR